jgi:uncharacterized YccA/Bax inhibitor family protein
MPLPVPRSGNPSLNDRVFGSQPRPAFGEERMTLQGTINKSFLLLVVLLAGAFWPWSQYLTTGDASVVTAPLMIGAIGGFILALIISFKANLAPVLSIPYAALEGLVLGSLSAIFERRYPGIAIQAVGLTFAVFAVMLVAYKLGIIRATERFRAVVIGATLSIAVVYAISMILGMFHVQAPLMVLNSGTPLGIIISLVIVGVAALNLILDFNFIESGAAQGAPRYMEWYGAFALLVTMVWLYLEILRLLSKVRRD